MQQRLWLWCFQALPEGHWQTSSSLMLHGVCLSGLKRYDEAEAALLEAHEILKSAQGANHEQTTEAVGALAELYDAWHAAEPGEGHDAKATEWRVKLPDTDPDSPSP